MIVMFPYRLQQCAKSGKLLGGGGGGGGGRYPKLLAGLNIGLAHDLSS